MKSTWPGIITLIHVHISTTPNPRRGRVPSSESSSLSKNMTDSGSTIRQIKWGSRIRLFLRRQMCAVTPPKAQNANEQAPLYSSKVSRHKTDSESTKRQNKRRLTWSMIIALQNMRTKAWQTKNPSIKAPTHTSNISEHMTDFENRKRENEIRLT